MILRKESFFLFGRIDIFVTIFLIINKNHETQMNEEKSGTIFTKTFSLICTIDFATHRRQHTHRQTERGENSLITTDT